MIYVYDFDAVVDRTGTSSVKWEKYRGKDIIPLWVADMDFKSPPSVTEALHRRVEHGVFGYTLPPEELSELLIEVVRIRYRWSIRPEWVIWLPGLVTGLNAACRAVGEDGDEVMTAVPVYPPFLSAPANSRRGLVKVPLRHTGDGWELDFDEIERAITPRTRLFLLCNPHNPVGRLYGPDELSKLAEICGRHDIKICSDEIHCDLILDRELAHVPTASLDSGVAARTITLMAPSKTFNIAGLGCSFAVIPDKRLRLAFRAACAGIVPHVNALGFTAALGAWRGGWEWLSALQDYLGANRDLVEREIGAMPRLSMAHVEATYLAWIDATVLETDKPARFFEDAGVGLQDGADFGLPGYVRLNFGCRRALLSEALGRMARAVG